MPARHSLALLVVWSVAGGLAVAAPPASTGQPVDLDRTAPRWSAVRTLAPDPSSAALAVDGKGVTTVAWSNTVFPAQVVVRCRTSDGTWGARTVLGEGRSPQVAADQRGVTTVVWVLEREGSADAVMAARRIQTGGWSAPVVISRAPAEAAPTARVSHLVLSAAPGGALVAAWAWGNEDEGLDNRIQSAFRPRSGRWRKAVDVTPANGATQPEVGIARDGTATVVYGLQAFGEPQELIARVRGRGGRWSSPARIAAEGYGHEVAVARDGRAVVAFTSDFATARAVTRSPTGRWGTPRTLVRGDDLDSIDVVVSRRRRFVVATAGGDGQVDVVERARRGGWSEPTRLASGNIAASEVVVAANDHGDTFVGWGSYGVFGRFRPYGEDWTGVATVWPDAGVDVLESLASVVTPAGDVAVLWDQEASPLRIRVRTHGTA